MKILFLMATLFLVGCSSTYERIDIKTLSSPLNKDKPVFVTQPVNGSYGEIVYHNSGVMTQLALQKSLTTYTELTDSKTTAGYIFEPKILHWEDRATEWSGKKDKITIQVRVYKMPSKEKVADSTINGSSKFITFGGDHPQDLLKEPFDLFIKSLYDTGKGK